MNIVQNIIDYKKLELKQSKTQIGFAELEKSELFLKPAISLRKSLLDKTKTGIIAEFKRKSPSKGIINNEADVNEVTTAYTEFGASCLSVLTDEYFFGGCNKDLKIARKNSIPILRKDFIIDEYQIIESKAIGADVILLIAACLTKNEIKKFAAFAKNIGVQVLLEIHDESEFDHICDEIEFVGINNRNLKTFELDIDRSLRMAEKIPNDKLKIAESGINAVQDVLMFKKNGFDGFLIGEKFMQEKQSGIAFKDFVRELKIMQQ